MKRVLIAAILGLLVVVIFTSVQSKAIEPTTNKVVTRISDNFKTNTSETSYLMETGGIWKKIPKFELTDSAIENQEEEIQDFVGQKKLAVILINFKNNKTQPWTKDEINNWSFVTPASLASYVFETSFGKISLTGSVYGYYTMPTKNTACDDQNWLLEAERQATRDGYKKDNFDFIMLAFPKTDACIFTGWADLRGKYSWINGTFAEGNSTKLTYHAIPIHELMHNFGANHASSLTCTSESGSPAPLSNNCQQNEYGDIFDVMGGFGNTRQLNSPHKRDVGWLPKNKIVTVNTTGIYKLNPVELLGDHPNSLRILRNTNQENKIEEYFYLEFRKPNTSFDNFQSTAPVSQGITIRIGNSKVGKIKQFTNTKLLDMHPETPLVNDAPLLVGEKFTDPKTGIQIETLKVKPNVAEVKITLPNSL